MTNVSWHDAHRYIERPNQAKGKQVFRMPSAQEWELGCRAGAPGHVAIQAKESTLSQYAWWGKNSGDRSHPVGGLRPNAFGLYDMLGNVAEWCETAEDPKAKDILRVNAGGHFSDQNLVGQDCSTTSWLRTRTPGRDGRGCASQRALARRCRARRGRSREVDSARRRPKKKHDIGKEHQMRNCVRLNLVIGICLGLSLASASARAAQDVEGTPQAKAYRASLKAIAAGDYQAYRKTLSSSTLKQMDEQTKGKSPKEVMEFTKMMSPTDVKLTSVKVEGQEGDARGLREDGWPGDEGLDRAAGRGRTVEGRAAKLAAGEVDGEQPAARYLRQTSRSARWRERRGR